MPVDRPQSSQTDLNAVRALALDTNAFPHGQLNISALRRLVQRAAAHGGVEIWVPEVALWEWAAHAAAERQQAVSALEAVRPAGLDVPALPLLSKMDVLSQLRVAVLALGEPLRLLPAAPVAGEALRDQILVEGPAKTVNAKDGRAIKTGAADSALLRSVLQAAAGDTRAFVLVSSDSDVLAAFTAWNMAVPALFRSPTTASAAVFAAVPSDAAIQASCLSVLAQSIDQQELGRLSGDVVADLYDDYTSEVANEESYAHEGRQVVGLSEVFVDRRAGEAFGTAHVLAAVTATGVVQDSSGDSTVTRWSEVVGASVRIPVTFELTGATVVSAAAETGEGVASRPAPEDYTGSDDAWHDLVGCLQTLPGAAALQWDEPAEGEAGSRTVDVAGAGRLRLIFEGDVQEEWTLSAELDGVTLAIVGCRSLNDGFSDREGFSIPNHYALWTDVAVGFGSRNPVWALNAAVLPVPSYDWFAGQDPHG